MYSDSARRSWSQWVFSGKKLVEGVSPCTHRSVGKEVRLLKGGKTLIPVVVRAIQLLFAALVERYLFHTQMTFTSVIGTIIIIGAALWIAVSTETARHTCIQHC